MEEYESAPTSPTLPTNDGTVNSARAFSNALTLDLTDSEISAAFRIIMRIRHKYMTIFRSKFNDPSTFHIDDIHEYISSFDDEIKYELADKCGILASVDTVPLLEGKPMAIEYVGKISTPSDAYGFDHERKEFEVKLANNRGEDYYGQKGPTNRGSKK